MFIILCLGFLLLDSLGDSHNLQSRSVIGNRDGLWPDGIVSYSFDSSVSTRLQNVIKEAMNEWEVKTCIRLIERTDQQDYIVFISQPNMEYCTCDSTGRLNGQQEIILGYSCQSKGELLHTLGHVIGFWHEQARPDRNKYVKIQLDAVEGRQEESFRKRSDFTVGYEGANYDFGSVMHLSPLAYSTDGRMTTEVRNVDEFEKQGSPSLGQRIKLSEGDVLRANRLYHCPGGGLQGILEVEIKNAERLTITHNPYVEVTAVDTEGKQVTLSTSKEQQDRNPVWNKVLKFPIQSPRQWQFFRINILGDNMPLSMPLTVPVMAGRHSDFHCINAVDNCEGRLNYNYTFQEDGNECAGNPCSNGGECIDGFVEFQCNCLRGWGGKTCEKDESGNSCIPNPCDNAIRCEDRFFDYFCVCVGGFHGKNCDQCNANYCLRDNPCIGATCDCRRQFAPPRCQNFRSSLQLTVKIERATGLQDEDPILNLSDPYVDVYAFGEHRRSRIQGGTLDPTWNDYLVFSCQHNINNGPRFRFVVRDDDGFLTFRDDRLSDDVDIDFGTINYYPHSASSGLGGYRGVLYYRIVLTPC